jgi:hypothetical protein
MPASPRTFNVFSPVIVVYEGEQFNWTVNQAELGSATEIVVSPVAGVWPLEKPSYTVKANALTPATVTGNVGADFRCSIKAPNITTQKIITTPKPAKTACNQVNVAPGNYFIWLNETADTQIIRPDSSNPNYWPLPQPHYAVPPNSWIAVQVPSGATFGNYPVTVHDKGGLSQCTELTQPIIIVGSN